MPRATLGSCPKVGLEVKLYDSFILIVHKIVLVLLTKNDAGLLNCHAAALIKSLFPVLPYHVFICAF